MKKQSKTIPVAPNIPAFVREVTEYGNIGAMARRVLRLGLRNIIALAWLNKASVLKIAKKDFTAGMVLLLQTELLAGKRRSEYMAVSDQVVDLAVALHNTRLIQGLVSAVKVAGLKPVLVTNNLSHLMRFLSDTKIRDVWLSYPSDPEGYGRIIEPSRVIAYELLA